MRRLTKFNRKLSLNIDTIHQRLDTLKQLPDTFVNRRKIKTLEKILKELHKKVPV